MPPFGVNTFASYEDFSEYSPMGRDYGNPMLNAMAFGMFGNNYMPRPGQGQDMWDAFESRARSGHFMNLQGSSFRNSAFSQKMGMQNSSLAQAFGRYGASPDSAVARMLSPLQGGNPMAAQMQIYAGLAGANTMGNWGRSGTVGESEAESIMSGIGSQFYKTQAYEGDKGGRQEIIKKSRGGMTKALAENNAAYLNDLGIGVSVDKAGKITDASRSAAEQKIASFDVTGLEGDKLINESSSRKMQSTKVLDEVNKQLEENGGKLEKNYAKALAEQIKGWGKDTEKAVAEAKKGKSGDLRDLISAYGDRLHPAAAEAIRSRELEKQGEIYKNFNFANSRGFAIEDITAGFRKGAEYRMLGNNKGESIAETAAGFAKNAGGVLDAGGALVGRDKGAGYIMSQINELVGTGGADLHTTEGSAKVEKLLRDVKSTAHVAGISIKTMLAIIDQTKQLAASSPQLSRVSSSVLTQMSLSAVKTAATMGSVMSAEDFRKSGGQQGIAAAQLQSMADFHETGFGQTVTTLLGMAQGDPATYEEIKKDYMEGRLTPDSLSQGYHQKYAAALGMDPLKMNSVLSDPGMAAYYGEDETVKGDVEAGRKKATSKNLLKEMRIDYNDLLEKFKGTGGKDMHSFFGKLMAEAPTEYRDRLRKQQSVIQEQLYRDAMPKEQREAMDKEIEHRTATATKLSKEYASLNAPMATQLVSALAAGEGDYSKTIDALVGIFAAPDKSSADTRNAMVEAKKGAEQLITDLGTQTDAELYSSYGLAENFNKITTGTNRFGGKDADKMKDLTSDEIKQIAENSKDLTAVDAASARARLADLKKQDSSSTHYRENWNDDTKREYNTLLLNEQAGNLRYDSTYDLVHGNKNKSLNAVLGAAVEGARLSAGESKRNELRQGVLGEISADLTTGLSRVDSNSLTGQQMKGFSDFYGGDTAKAMEDFGKSAGYFTNFTDDKMDAAAKAAYTGTGGLKSLLVGGQNKLNSLEQELGDAGKGAPVEDKGRIAMREMLSGLGVQADKLGGAIGELAKAIAGK